MSYSPDYRALIHKNGNIAIYPPGEGKGEYLLCSPTKAPHMVHGGICYENIIKLCGSDVEEIPVYNAFLHVEQHPLIMQIAPQATQFMQEYNAVFSFKEREYRAFADGSHSKTIYRVFITEERRYLRFENWPGGRITMDSGMNIQDIIAQRSQREVRVEVVMRLAKSVVDSNFGDTPFDVQEFIAYYESNAGTSKKRRVELMMDANGNISLPSDFSMTLEVSREETVDPNTFEVRPSIVEPVSLVFQGKQYTISPAINGC